MPKPPDARDDRTASSNASLIAIMLVVVLFDVSFHCPLRRAATKSSFFERVQNGISSLSTYSGVSFAEHDEMPGHP
jgi:hypothetical protein